MKHQTFLYLAMILMAFTGSQCKKNKDKEPLLLLPPETQTGANTFGCLVDGEPFIPKGNPLSGPILKAQYQFVNGKQGFGVSARNTDGNQSKIIGISGDSIQLAVGNFDLTGVGVGNFTAGYTFRDIDNLQGIQYGTSNINYGQLIIKKFDTINQIVSGTFWFDAKNNNDQVIQIREGRFDLPYVR